MSWARKLAGWFVDTRAVMRAWGPTELPRTLLLSLETVQTAPRFFSTLALVLRASGHEIVMLANVELSRQLALELDVPFTSWEYVPSMAGTTAHLAVKLTLARQYAAKGPTIWIDMDLAGWPQSYPDPTKIENLVILNWAALLARHKRGEVGLS